MSLLILGCRPTLTNVEAEVTTIAATAPGAELLLDHGLVLHLAGRQVSLEGWVR